VKLEPAPQKTTLYTGILYTQVLIDQVISECVCPFNQVVC